MAEITSLGDRARALRTMLDELRWTVANLCDEVRRIGPALVARSRALDKVWAVNQVCFQDPVDCARAVALTDEHMSEMPFRHIVIEHETTGQELEPSFRANGWDVDREVLMKLVSRPDRIVADSELVELSEQQMVAIMELWALEEHVGIAPDRLSQLMEFNRRAGRLWNERCFGVLDEAGSAVSIAKLRVHDRVAWVEDVYTVPGSRGLGHARMLVTHAVKLAAARRGELTFIVADFDDWPKDLYSRLGFEPVGMSRTFRLSI